MKRLYFLILILIITIFTGCSVSKVKENQDNTVNLKGNGLIVLCYHRTYSEKILDLGMMLDPDDSELTRYAISTKELNSQLGYLQKEGIHFVTPEEAEDYLMGRFDCSGKMVLVTFDDGDLSIYKNSFPILRKRKIPFLLFLIAGQAGKRWEEFTMCSWAQVKEMMDSGLCTVGLHTYNMHYVDSQTKKPVFLNAAKEKEFADDLECGINCCRKQLGINIRYFAYPYGFGTPATDKIIISHQIPNIFTLRGKVNNKGDKRFYIGRVLVTSESWKYIVDWANSK